MDTIKRIYPELIGSAVGLALISLVVWLSDGLKETSAEADAKAAIACANVTNANWREDGWGSNTSAEMCERHIRDYVYNSLDRDEGLRPCVFAGLPKFCRRYDDELDVYNIYGDHSIFLSITGEDLKRTSSHVVWLADPP